MLGLLDKDGSGFLEMVDLKEALDIVGFRLPQWEVRLLTEEMERDQPIDLRGKMTFNEFQRLCGDIKSRDVANTFKGMISRRENLETLGGMSTASSEGTTHTVRQEEQVAFSDWINSNLGSDPDLKHILPIDQDGRALYDKVKDGILLCKIINHSCPDTIDERAINKRNQTVYTRHENLTLALNSAQAIGCNIINIDAHDLARGKPHLVLGLLWQIIRIGLFNQISLEHCPGLVKLVESGEDLVRLSPESILLRWVNHHLERAGTPRRCSNFTSDIKDSEIYTYLLKQIAPPDAGVTTQALMWSGRPSLPESTVARIDEMVRANRRITLGEIEDGLNEDCSHFSVHKIVSETLGYRKVSARWVDKWLKEAAGEWYNTGITKLVDRMKKEPDLLARAEQMLQQAEKLGCRSFLTPANVVEGVYKLNLAFVANLFNNHPGLDSDGPANDGEYESLEETREEKTIYNQVPFNIPFPNIFYRKLIAGKGSFADLWDFDPVQAQGFTYLLQYEEDDFGDIFEDFVMENGREVPLTQKNKKAYVDNYVDNLLNNDIKENFEDSKVIQNLWELLQERDQDFTKTLLKFSTGSQCMPVKDKPLVIQRHGPDSELLPSAMTCYNVLLLPEYSSKEKLQEKDSKVIQNLWELLQERDQDFTKTLLKFSTGSQCMPVKDKPLVIQRHGPDSELLPSAMTCYNVLLLPEYSSKEKLQEKLDMALQNTEGFCLC
ncbi:PLS3 [Cordylochernes scorpioides]|uniref:PLS3 n=1 Tax=Cordylochernes scorpioides TaxID=51811 RepID=A0ABY6KKG9_9ARAC|nr:PLS3 [Cordylochernes scorpioides]